MRKSYALFAAAAVLGSVALTGTASAMPNGLSSTSLATSSNVEHVRWVCGPYRCWWRPNYWGAYGFYGPRRWWGPRWGWGWRRGWHRWHRW
jgi:hypothetical protein